ncbi:hypothetical protein Tco_1440957 [Tanacetum coccineum]
MEATLNDMLSNQFKNAEEYTYHLEQAINFIENQIVWESKQEDIRRQVPRPLIFFGPQRNPNEPLRYLYNKYLFFLKNGNTEEKKSRLIWERVQDFQLGIKSYQVKVNLTAPTLTFHGIEAYEPYSVVNKPNTEKVLKEVNLKIFQSELWKKPPLLGEIDRDIMRVFEREITKRLSHREQMRRCESFVNRRPIIPTMKRL